MRVQLVYNSNIIEPVRVRATVKLKIIPGEDVWNTISGATSSTFTFVDSIDVPTDLRGIEPITLIDFKDGDDYCKTSCSQHYKKDFY